MQPMLTIANIGRYPCSLTEIGKTIIVCKGKRNSCHHYHCQAQRGSIMAGKTAEVVKEMASFHLSDVGEHDEGIPGKIVLMNTDSNEDRKGAGAARELVPHPATSLGTMESLECPFTWPLVLHDYDNQIKIKHLREKLKANDDSTSLLYLIGVHVTLCREYVVAKMHEEAFAHLTFAAEYAADMPGDARRGVMSVILGSKCHVLKDVNNDYKTTLSKLVPLKELSAKGKALVHGLHGMTLLHYSPSNYPVAKREFEKAIKLDERNAVFWLGFGRASARYRRIVDNSAEPYVEEGEAFETALKLQPNDTGCKTFVADNLLQKSSFLRRNRYLESKDEVNALSKRAYDLFCEVLTSGNATYSGLIKCADGFRYLPTPFRDLEMSKKCLQLAMELSPNESQAYHKAALLYKLENNLRLAKDLLSKAVDKAPGNLPARICLLRTNLELDARLDPVLELKKLYEEIDCPQKKATILGVEGLYHMEKKKDMRAAVDCWSRALDFAHCDTQLKVVHRVSGSTAPVDVWPMFTKALQNLLEDRRVLQDERVRYQALLEKVTDITGAEAVGRTGATKTNQQERRRTRWQHHRPSDTYETSAMRWQEHRPSDTYETSAMRWQEHRRSEINEGSGTRWEEHRPPNELERNGKGWRAPRRLERYETTGTKRQD